MVCINRQYQFKFFKGVFHKFNLVHSGILCPKCFTFKNKTLWYSKNIVLFHVKLCQKHKTLSFGHTFLFIPKTEAVFQPCSQKKMFEKLAANLQKNTNANTSCCKFAAYFQNNFFQKIPLEGCFWKSSNYISYHSQ